MGQLKSFDLEYNSLRDNLIISEYGRNVQKLVEHAKSIEDRELRQGFIEEIINLMTIMIPANKSLVDHKQKMWNHVFKIADYELDIDLPQGIEITKTEEVKIEPDLQYPKATYKFRHYGAYIQQMISQARRMDIPEKKEGYSDAIASYMKLSYQTWNKEHYVNDAVIKQDLEEISEGDLTFDDDYSIDNLVSIKQLKEEAMKKPMKHSNSSNNKKKFVKTNRKPRR